MRSTPPPSPAPVTQRLDAKRAAVLALLVAAASACAPPMPPKELADARTQYNLAMKGPAAAETPAQLHTAKNALDEAERSFSEDGNEQHVRDQAYVALRKVQLADASAGVMLARKAKAHAEKESERVTAKKLESTESALEASRANLEKTQEQLDREKTARAEAEKKAAQALADLQKIATVKQESRGMVITLSGSVLFATDQSELLPAANAKLTEVANALTRGNKDANITVEGHTDAQGSREHNMQLGRERAESVKAQLVARGVAPDRIKAVGLGPDRPVANNSSAEGRANNRRVEIIVEPMAQAGAGSLAPTP